MCNFSGCLAARVWMSGLGWPCRLPHAYPLPEGGSSEKQPSAEVRWPEAEAATSPPQVGTGTTASTVQRETLGRKGYHTPGSSILYRKSEQGRVIALWLLRLPFPCINSRTTTLTSIDETEFILRSH